MSWRLYLDIGNTNVHWAAFANDEWITEDRLPTALLGQATLHAHLSRPLEEIGLSLSEADAVVAVASHPEGVASLEQCVEDICGLPVTLVGRDLRAAIEVDYREPGRIGADRVVDAYAARELYGAPCVVLDFGTCLTCEAVSAEGRLVGGAIAPGLPVIQAGLTELVSRLRRPFEKATEHPSDPAARAETKLGDTPGRDTEENLRLGCVGGMAAAADWLIERAHDWVGQNAPAVAAGGDAPLVVPLCRAELQINPMLTLEGLRLIDLHSSS